MNESAAFAVLGGTVTVGAVLCLAFLILLVIARWKIFTKAGEAGWKSIIPIYADYVMWRIGWKKKYLFFVAIIMTFVGLLLMQAGGVPLDATTANEMANLEMSTLTNTPAAIVGMIIVIAAAVLELVALYKLLQSFGKGIVWFILFLFFTPIMLLILGFGSSVYRGARE